MNTPSSQTPDWSLLDRYVASECSPAERVVIAEWLESSQDAQAMLAGLQDGAREALPSRSVSGMTPQSMTPQSTRSQIPMAASAASRMNRHRSKWIPYASLSAIALLLVWGSWSWTAAYRDPNITVADTRVITTAPRERARIQLSDGSAVVLAPGSELRYIASQNGAHRTVDLRGAALFTVTHADASPFIVRTASGDVQVLGTSFTVRQYAEDSSMHVVVASGRVGVGASVLSSGDAIRVNNNGTQQVTHAVNVAAALSWTHGRLEFRSEPLRNVLPELERWYGMHIDADPALLEKTVTLSLTTETHREIVQLLSVVLDASADVRRTQISLSPR